MPALSQHSIPTLPKLFVSGFSLEITELELARLIAPHGDIATIKIVRDKKTRLCKGYAFVEMETIGGAQAAIEALDGTPIADRLLTVKLTEAKQVAPAPPSRTPNSKYTKAGYVTTADTTEQPRRLRKRLGA